MQAYTRIQLFEAEPQSSKRVHFRSAGIIVGASALTAVSPRHMSHMLGCKSEFNFSKLNYNIHSIYFRAKAFIAGYWEVKERIQLFKRTKCIHLRAKALIANSRSLWLLGSKRRSRNGQFHIVDPHTESTTRIFSFNLFSCQSMKKGLYTRD